MIYTAIVFLTNLILALASIFPIVLRDNRGEIKAPKETIKAIAVCFLEGFLKTASTPDGIELINQWAAEYQAELETKKPAKKPKQKCVECKK